MELTEDIHNEEKFFQPEKDPIQVKIEELQQKNFQTASDIIRQK